MIKWILLLIFFSISLSAEQHSPFVKSLRQFGDIGQFAIPLTAGGIALQKRDHKGLQRLALVMAVNQLSVEVLKRVTNKKRPDGGIHSFPSGHTAAAFAGAGFLHRRYGASYAIPAYIFAAIVGWSRILAKRHRMEDVLGGAALGVGVNLIFTPSHGSALSIDINL